MYVFTLGAKFFYKRTPNDDLPTVTSIFKKINGIWENPLDAKIDRRFRSVSEGLVSN